ncbi:hypothetical protein P43SY_009755 [Pythium insidiosum]|uniref:DUF155 domain-containing protein n=1 Tax=Pythium insidiosum TaxID=114742 RepID=A0AAD5QDK7_PYTIN|nr:hypothetical protein P43SY_009755 [Pythium insidiosum]KAJ0410979.1 hypothetical protein ATCC90586_007133 [Pythium insidiosum]
MAEMTERSPLLPKGDSRKSVSWLGGGDEKGAEQTQTQVRRRAGRRGRGIAEEEDGEEEEEEEDNNRGIDGGHKAEDPAEDGRRIVTRRVSPLLGYGSDSAAASSLGVARRKPRWAGFRSKVASLSDDAPREVVPRYKARRNRFRSTDYDEAVAMTRMMRPQPPTDRPKGRVAAYCTCEQISLFKLLKWLDRATKEGKMPAGNALAGWRNKMYMGVVHSSFDPARDANASRDEDRDLLKRKDAFYFATGCCVFWGLTREEELVHLQALTAFSTGPVAEIEAEDMEFVYGESSRVANDEITLSTETVEEKLAISFAMSQSAKLDVFEERVEQRIRNTKHIPFNLATTGSMQYSQKDISKLIGQLFIELADVNLHSDILDEPDFLWEHDEYEPLHKKMLKYLDVTNRVKILNKRLDILRELVEVLNQELAQKHGAKLEWIIIWLLVAEIVIAVGWNIIVKDLLGFFNRK